MSSWVQNEKLPQTNKQTNPNLSHRRLFSTLLLKFKTLCCRWASAHTVDQISEFEVSRVYRTSPGQLDIHRQTLSQTTTTKCLRQDILSLISGLITLPGRLLLVVCMLYKCMFMDVCSDQRSTLGVFFNPSPPIFIKHNYIMLSFPSLLTPPGLSGGHDFLFFNCCCYMDTCT